MRTMRLAVAILVTVALAGSLLSAHDEFRFVGTISKVDAAKDRVSVTFKDQGKDDTVQIQMAKTTPITRENRPATKADLRVGVSVVVDALGDDYDSLEAVVIKIVPPIK